MRKGSGSIKGKVKSLTNSSYYDEYECDSLWALNRTVAGMLGGYMDTLSRCRGQTAGAVCGDGGGQHNRHQNQSASCSAIDNCSPYRARSLLSFMVAFTYTLGQFFLSLCKHFLHFCVATLTLVRQQNADVIQTGHSMNCLLVYNT